MGVNLASAIEECFNTGTVTSQYNSSSIYSMDNIGGILGYGNSATIKNSYNTGAVAGYSSVGGIVGKLTSNGGYTTGGTANNTYNATTDVKGNNTIGNWGGTVTNVTGNYNSSILNETTNGSSSNNSFSNYKGYSLSDMKNKSDLLNLMKNGNGSGKWAQSSSINSGLPYLSNNTP